VSTAGGEDEDGGGGGGGGGGATQRWATMTAEVAVDLPARYAHVLFIVL
jgi:hypothetical protein